MASDLKLQVILNGVNKLTRPFRSATQDSIGLARSLKESRDQLKALKATQSDISSWRTLHAESRKTEAALTAARDRVKSLGAAMNATGVPTRQMTRDLRAAIRESSSLKREHQQQQTALQGMRNKLDAAGISTRKLRQGEFDLRQRIEQTNRSISEQGRRMERLSAQTRRLAIARNQFDKAQQVAGGMAAAGAAGLASGYALSRPIQGIVDAFAPAENAATQLRVSMMDRNGQVAADFQRISDLATGLGDRLPGTTADFQEMMTMLRRQGISARSILGGTGEAAAYLGVQLQMGVSDAAEFAAKMQDATRTSEKDMMALMDTIQRAFYSGVDPTNMLQGFSKISPVMDIIKKQGLEAADALAPLLVMMDQTGMAGESSGNAFRKVFQGAMNNSKISRVLKDLQAEKGIKLKLDFTDGKGEFAGIENLFAQLDKLKTLTTEDRLGVIKALFGDDAETLQVLNTMMNKGIAGYEEVAAKMQDQADLRNRVNEQLGTLTNIIEAAEGSWTNAMSEIGSSIAPELKETIEGFGNLAVAVKDWVKEHPGLTAAIVKTAAGLAMLLTAGGGIAVMIASFLGPFAMARYAVMLFSATLMGTPIGWMILGITALAAAVYLLYDNWDGITAYFKGLWAEIKEGFNGGFAGITRLILNFSPLGLFYRAFAGVMSLFGVEMPAKFTDFGKLLIQGLIDGIKAMAPALKAAAVQAANDGFASLREQLNFIPAIGALNAGARVVQQFRSEGDQLRPAPEFDGRGPLKPRPVSNTTIGPTTIQIHAAPGMDERALARLVEEKIAENTRRIAARGRSSLADQE